MLAALAIGVLGFTSCKKDDDGDGGDQKTCKTCEILSIESQYCDNGDGTLTVTLGGQSVTQSLNGVSFTDFISQAEAAGSTCK